MLHQLPPAPCTGFVPRPSDPSAFRLISALEMTGRTGLGNRNANSTDAVRSAAKTLG